MLFIDVLIYLYRIGVIRYPEQQKNLVYLTEMAADDSVKDEHDRILTFLQTLSNFGFSNRSVIYKNAEQFLAAPDAFRGKFPGFFCIPSATEHPHLLTDNKVFFMVEPLLSISQRKLFEQDFWFFKRQHTEQFIACEQKEQDPQLQMGVYAHEATDNLATLDRLEAHFQYLCNQSSAKKRAQYEGFPLKILMQVLRRAFPDDRV